MKNETTLLSLEKFWTSRGLQLGWRHYRKLAKEGILPDPDKGNVDALDALARLAAYYQGKAAAHGDTTLTDERRRKTAAEASIKEMQQKQLSGELIDRATVADEFCKRAVIVKGDLLAIPRRIAKWPDAAAIVKQRVLQILRTYSRPLPAEMRSPKGGKK